MTALLNSSGVGWPLNVVAQRTETSTIVMMLLTSMSFAILSLIFISSTFEAILLHFLVCFRADIPIDLEATTILEFSHSSEQVLAEVIA